MTTSEYLSADPPGGVRMPLVGFGTWQLRGQSAANFDVFGFDLSPEEVRHLDGLGD